MLSCAWSFDKDKLGILLLVSQPANFKDRLFSHLINKFSYSTYIYHLYNCINGMIYMIPHIYCIY